MVQNVTQYCHVCKSQTTSGPPVVLTRAFNILHTRQSEVHGKTPPVLLKTVDLCLEMSSDFKYSFCFVVEKFSSLHGNTTNLDVSESALKADKRRGRSDRQRTLSDD